MDYKQHTIKLALNPKFKRTIETDLVAWSHDKNSYKFYFELSNTCGEPIILDSAIGRIKLDFLREGKTIIESLDVESEHLGLASFTIPDGVLGYEGKVEAHVYLDYESQTHDLGSFSFLMKKSSIDNKLPDLEFYVSEWDEALKKAEELNEQIKDRDLVTKHELNAVERAKADKETLSKNVYDLQEQINNTASGFLGEFTSEADLNRRYPEGAKGYAVVYFSEVINDKNEKVGYTYTYKDSVWFKGTVWNAVKIANNSISEEKLSFPVVKGKILNMYNFEDNTRNGYIDYKTGRFMANVKGFEATDYINVMPGQKIHYFPDSGQQMAFYGENFSYKHGLVRMPSEIVVPEGCFKMRLTLKQEYIYTTVVTLDKSIKEYVSHNPVIKTEDIYNLEKKIIDVAENYSNIYVSSMSDLYSILKSHDVSKTKNIFLEAGTYNTLEPFSDEQIKKNNFFGLIIPDNINIIGNSNRRNIKFVCDVSKYEYNVRERISTLNLSSINIIKSISVFNVGGRYPIHDDMNTKNIEARRLIKDVYAFQSKNSALAPAYGAGCFSGAYIEIEDCVFESQKGTPFAFHGYKDFKTPFNLKVSNTSMRNLSTETVSVEKYNFSVDITCMKSNVTNNVVFLNCEIGEGIILRADDNLNLNPDGSIDTRISGSGNTRDFQTVIKNRDSRDYTENIFFNDVHSKKIASEDIKKGDKLSMKSGRFVVKSTLNSDILGVAINDALKGEYVFYFLID